MCVCLGYKNSNKKSKNDTYKFIFMFNIFVCHKIYSFKKSQQSKSKSKT